MAGSVKLRPHQATLHPRPRPAEPDRSECPQRTQSRGWRAPSNSARTKQACTHRRDRQSRIARSVPSEPSHGDGGLRQTPPAPSDPSPTTATGRAGSLVVSVAPTSGRRAATMWAVDARFLGGLCTSSAHILPERVWLGRCGWAGAARRDRRPVRGRSGTPPPPQRGAERRRSGRPPAARPRAHRRCPRR